MPHAAFSPPARKGLVACGLLACLVVLALWIAQAPVHLPLLTVAAVVLFLTTLLHAEAGLVIVVLSMLLSPEFVLGGAGGIGLEGRRHVILRSEDLILLIVGLAWMARMAIHKDLGAIRRTCLNAYIGAYVACCLISTLIGIEVGRVRPLVGLCFVTKYIEYFLVYFITVNYVRGESQLRRLLGAVLVTASLITVYACWQIPSGVRPSAPFEGPEGEPNTLGGYLVLIFSVAAAIAMGVTERRWRLSGAALAIGLVPPLLATLSRASWLAFAGSILTLIALSPSRRRLAAVAMVVVALLLLFLPHEVEDRVRYTFEPRPDSVRLGHVQLDSSSSARIASWGAALRAFSHHPLLGWGITGYGFLDAQYFRALVELGLIGFAAFLVLLLATLSAFYRAQAALRDPLHRALGLGMVAALVGLSIHALAANTFILIRIMEPFWLLTGLVIAATTLQAEAETPGGASP